MAITLQRIDFALRPLAPRQRGVDLGAILRRQADIADAQRVAQMPGMAGADDNAGHQRLIEDVARGNVGDARPVAIGDTVTISFPPEATLVLAGAASASASIEQAIAEV